VVVDTAQRIAEARTPALGSLVLIHALSTDIAALRSNVVVLSAI
jgi:hypothetical protein